MNKKTANLNSTALSHDIIIPATVIAAGICGFFIILCQVLSENTAAFDDSIRFWFYSIRKTRTGFGIPLASGALFITLLNKIIKISVQRPRPDVSLHLISESGFSFTSGHSITSIFFYGMLIWLVRKHVANPTAKNILTIVLLIPILGIGLSRIYCGVHYPTDVLAGWCLGLAVLSSEILILRQRLRRNRPVQAQSR